MGSKYGNQSIGREMVQDAIGYHPGTEMTIPEHSTLRETAIAFANFLDDLVYPSPEKDEAWRRFQEAIMWANKAIALQAPVVIGREHVTGY